MRASKKSAIADTIHLRITKNPWKSELRTGSFSQYVNMLCGVSPCGIPTSTESSALTNLLTIGLKYLDCR